MMSTPIKLNNEELRGTDRTAWNQPPSGSANKEQPAAAGEILEWNTEINPPAVRDDNGWRTATSEEIAEQRTPPPPIPNWNDQLEEARSRLIKPIEGLNNFELMIAAPSNDMFEVEEKGPTTFEEAFDAVVADLRTIMIQRQRKYGKKNIQKHRDYGVAMRISDKEARIHNSYFDADGRPRPKPLDDMGDESLDDTFVDIANYAIIALMVRSGTFDLPLKENL